MPSQLTIYVQRGCLFSEEALAWLAERDTPYQVIERDIDSDPDALHDLERLETIVTPTILIGDEIIYGFDEERLAHLLKGREKTSTSRTGGADRQKGSEHGLHPDS